jgi:NAD(P)-dependent dehydrogenase (short-subunit alcohol dehydrogenase family)
VIIADRDLARATQIAGEIGGTALGYEQDDPSSVAALFREVAAGGPLHGLAVVAGVHPGHRPLAETTEEGLVAVHGVNAAGVLSCLREAAGALVDDGTAAVVVVGSVAGIRPVARDAVYASSKAAAHAIVRSAALELAPRIRVNTVVPGFAVTPLSVSQSSREAIDETSERILPLRRPADAAEVASAICFLLSHDASYITATELLVDGGLAASGPR